MKDDLYYPHTFAQDLLWDTLYYCTEPLMRRWPLNMIRQKALDEAIKHMHYEAEETRYISIGCVPKVCESMIFKLCSFHGRYECIMSHFLLQCLEMMCWWAYDPNGIEFKHHLARIPDYLWLAEDGMKMQVLLIIFEVITCMHTKID